MKALILAGGLRTRRSEETNFKTKLMVQIGGKPYFIAHMKMYSSLGIRDFVTCCGYKWYVIKEYFDNCFLHMPDITIDMHNNTWKRTSVMQNHGGLH